MNVFYDLPVHLRDIVYHYITDTFEIYGRSHTQNEWSLLLTDRIMCFDYPPMLCVNHVVPYVKVVCNGKQIISTSMHLQDNGIFQSFVSTIDYGIHLDIRCKTSAFRGNVGGVIYLLVRPIRLYDSVYYL